MLPIRCFTCSKVLRISSNMLTELSSCTLENRTKILKELNVVRLCCIAHLMSSIVDDNRIVR